MKKGYLRHLFQSMKESWIFYELLTFVSAFCFFGSYFLFYYPTALCWIYPFNQGTVILFVLALLSSSIPVILIIKNRDESNKIYLFNIISRSAYFVFGILTRWGFIQYQRQGCGNIYRWYVYFMDAYSAIMILEIIIVVFFLIKKNRSQSKLSKPWS